MSGMLGEKGSVKKVAFQESLTSIRRKAGEASHAAGLRHITGSQEFSIGIVDR